MATEFLHFQRDPKALNARPAQASAGWMRETTVIECSSQLAGQLQKVARRDRHRGFAPRVKGGENVSADSLNGLHSRGGIQALDCSLWETDKVQYPLHSPAPLPLSSHAKPVDTFEQASN